MQDLTRLRSMTSPANGGLPHVSMMVQTLYLLADLYWVGHLGRERLPVEVAGNLTALFSLLPRCLGWEQLP